MATTETPDLCTACNGTGLASNTQLCPVCNGTPSAKLRAELENAEKKTGNVVEDVVEKVKEAVTPKKAAASEPVAEPSATVEASAPEVDTTSGATPVVE